MAGERSGDETMSTAAFILAATVALRNPFWPIGHNGEREAISPEPKFTAKQEAAALEEDVQTGLDIASAAERENAVQGGSDNKMWIAARNSLKFSGCSLRINGENSRQAIMINGKVYGDGDYVSINFEGMRFTWRIKNLTEGKTLKLKRVRMRSLSEDETMEKGQEK